MSTGERKNKLVIVRGKWEGNKVKFNDGDGDSVITVSFNPTEYSMDKSNVFAEANIPGLGSPILQFSRGNVRTLSLELLLGTYTGGPLKDSCWTLTPGEGEDLRTKYISKFEKLLDIDGELHAPPPCKVLWSKLEFVGVLESLRKRYVFFLDDGTPVRARLTLSFKEYIPVEIQLKTSPRSSPDKRKTYLVKQGDSLWQISSKAYGNPDQWRIIAEANNIEVPRFLQIKEKDEKEKEVVSMDKFIGKEIVIPHLRKR
jgi:hypothetical protein